MDFDPRRILVVEDQPEIAAVVKEILAEDGHSVTAALSAEEALEVLGSPGAEVDLLLLDMKLPKMSGSELLDHLPRLGREQLPVLAITAWHEVPSGVDAVLRKPFRIDDLLEAVRRFCPSRAA